MKKFISIHLKGFIFSMLFLISFVLWVASGDSIGPKETPSEYKGKERQELQR